MVSSVLSKARKLEYCSGYSTPQTIYIYISNPQTVWYGNAKLDIYGVVESLYEHPLAHCLTFVCVRDQVLSVFNSDP